MNLRFYSIGMALLLFLSMGSLGQAQQTFTTYQPNAFKLATSNADAADVSIDGKVAAAAQSIGDIYIWNTLPTDSTDPDLVVDFGDNIYGLAFSPDGKKLIVSNVNDNTIEIFDPVPTSPTDTPSVVIPMGFDVSDFICHPDGRMAVFERSGSASISVWNTIPTSNRPPDFVYYNGTGVANNTFNGNPWGMAMGPEGHVIVTDFNRDRALIFDSLMTSNADTATMVIGQPDFTSSGGGTDSNSIDGPLKPYITSDGKVVIAEFYNNRTTIWDSIPSMYSANASVVLGQPNFTSDLAHYPSGTVTDTNVRRPYEPSEDMWGRLFITCRDEGLTRCYGVIPPDTTNLRISMRRSSQTVQGCDTLLSDYRVVVHNDGPRNADHIMVVSAFPQQGGLQSFTPSQGTFYPRSSYWRVGSLNAGDSAVLTLNGYEWPDSSSNFVQSTFAGIKNAFVVDTQMSDNVVLYRDTLSINATHPTVSSLSIDTCGSTTLVLSPTFTGTTLNWFASMSSSSPVFTGPSLTLSNLQKDTSFYIQSINAQGCKSSMKLVEVNVGISQELSTFMPSSFSLDVPRSSGVAVSSTGMLAAIAQSADSVYVWNSLPMDSTPHDKAFYVKNPNGVTFSLDGSQLLVASTSGSEMHIWDSLAQAPYNKAPDLIVPTPTGFTGIEVFPDGKLYCAGHTSGNLYVYDSIPRSSSAQADDTLLMYSTGFVWGIDLDRMGRFYNARPTSQRVFIYDSIPTTNAEVPSLVMCQPSLGFSGTVGAELGLNTPNAVGVLSDQRVLVTGGWQNDSRVFVWDTPPLQSGDTADHVLGQPNFTSTMDYYPNGTATDTNMSEPYDVAEDLYGRIYIACRGVPGRVMVFGEMPNCTSEVSIHINGMSGVVCDSSTAVYEVVVQNNGTEPVVDVLANAMFADAAGYQGHSTSVGTYYPKSGDWVIPSIAAGDSAVLTLSGLLSLRPADTAFDMYAQIKRTSAIDMNHANNAYRGIQQVSGLAPQPPVATSNQVVDTCAGNTFNLTATSSNTIRWYTSATSTQVAGLGTTFSTGKLDDSTTFYAESFDGTCSSGRTAFQFNISALPETNASDSICPRGDSFSFRGQTYTAPGTYYDTVAKGGCDSVYSLTLHPYDVPSVALSNNGGDLVANVNGTFDSLHFYRNGNPFQIQNGTALTNPPSGNFRVSAFFDGCEGDLSNVVVITRVKGLAAETQVQLYPNPAREQFVVETEGISGTARLTLYNVQGQVVEMRPLSKEQETFYTEGLESGLYILEIRFDDGSQSRHKMAIE